MESDHGKTSAQLSSAGDSTELIECWSSAPSLREDGGPIFHAFSAASLLYRTPAETEEATSDRAGVYHAATGFIIALLRAERGFLLEVVSRGEAPPTLGSLLISRDVDGEIVAQAERKIPQALLSEVLKNRRPAFQMQIVPREGTEPGIQDPEAEDRPHAAAFPVESSGGLVGILCIENRFQPLELNRETLRLAKSYAAVIGSVVEIHRIRKENDSLWADVARLRDEKPRDAIPQTSVLRRESPRTPKRSELKGDYTALIGASPKMLEIFQVLDRISSSSAPVLITGESGTGKELIANAVHLNSPRRGKVFVSENCGALTETLLESELFGYMRGAFTGAGKDNKGLFELAIGGTLFLDEVGDMSPGMQKKLLRVLQEGVIRRVGGKEYISVDVRIISATNKELLEEVRAGNFREDLYYRLNVIALKMPPLRERKEDIPELVEFFLGELERETDVRKKVEPAAMHRLVQYHWPGNIRELRNEVKRLHALSDGEIGVQDISSGVLSGDSKNIPFQDLERQLSNLTLREATERLEKEMIRNALIQCRGNKSLMAKMLQVPKTSLYNKITKYGLDKV